MAGGLGARPRVPTMGLTQEQAELIISFVKWLFTEGSGAKGGI